MRLTQISLLMIVVLSISTVEISKLLINSDESSNFTISQDSIIQYLALGDSYTVGTSVSEDENFPSQLANLIQNNIKKKVKLEIIARAGWRTDQLLNVVNLGTIEPTYDFVTLLIGVNNQYQKKTFSQYKKEFPKLLKEAIKLTNGEPSHVIVVSIPDWAYTPFGIKNGRKNISKEIDKYNNFAKVSAEMHNVSFISITDITRNGIKKPNLVANDGLHPSGIAYRHFVDRIYPTVLSIIK